MLLELCAHIEPGICPQLYGRSIIVATVPVQVQAVVSNLVRNQRGSNGHFFPTGAGVGRSRPRYASATSHSAISAYINN